MQDVIEIPKKTPTFVMQLRSSGNKSVYIAPKSERSK